MTRNANTNKAANHIAAAAAAAASWHDAHNDQQKQLCYDAAVPPSFAPGSGERPGFFAVSRSQVPSLETTKDHATSPMPNLVTGLASPLEAPPPLAQLAQQVNQAQQSMMPALQRRSRLSAASLDLLNKAFKVPPVRPAAVPDPLQSPAARAPTAFVPSPSLPPGSARPQQGRRVAELTKPPLASAASAIPGIKSEINKQQQQRRQHHEEEQEEEGQGKGQRAGQQQRFKPFHEEKWSVRLSELRLFRSVHGHCHVPHHYENRQLARWVKRQRRQHKLLMEGKLSTMTFDRIALLEELGFVWDSHEAAWDEKVRELKMYKEKYGDTLVPSTWKVNPQLAVWVKCQRRQYKMYREGKFCAMTEKRVKELEEEGFCWEVRTTSTSTSSSCSSSAAASLAPNDRIPDSALTTSKLDPLQGREDEEVLNDSDMKWLLETISNSSP